MSIIGNRYRVASKNIHVKRSRNSTLTLVRRAGSKVYVAIVSGRCDPSNDLTSRVRVPIKG